MWTCPKCGREFKRTDQDHYCGKAPENVEEYIALQIPEVQGRVMELRNMIRGCVPEAREEIAWSMPRYKKDKVSVSFAACKKHISLYVDADILEHFRSQPDAFTIKKNAVYLPYDKELPQSIIKEIITQCFAVK